MEPQPEVRYARSGEAQIAYQVLGDGSVDLVYRPPWGNLVWNWEWPPYATFLRRLASFSRLIVVDRRGFGCSSGTPLAASIEVEVDDLLAVVEDAQGPPPIVFDAEGGFASLLAAATHPERLKGLVLYDGGAAGTGLIAGAGFGHISQTSARTGWSRCGRFLDRRPPLT